MYLGGAAVYNRNMSQVLYTDIEIDQKDTTRHMLGI